MEIAKDPLFVVAIVAMILIIWILVKKPPISQEPLRFSMNDTGYGFAVKTVDRVNNKFLIEYRPNLQNESAFARTRTCWYKTDGVPEEVLVPGTLFITSSVVGGLQFQKVAVASSMINGFGGVEQTYDRLNEYYHLSAEYLQQDSTYVYSFADHVSENF